MMLAGSQTHGLQSGSSFADWASLGKARRWARLQVRGEVEAEVEVGVRGDASQWCLPEACPIDVDAHPHACLSTWDITWACLS